MTVQWFERKELLCIDHVPDWGESFAKFTTDKNWLAWHPFVRTRSDGSVSWEKVTVNHKTGTHLDPKQTARLDMAGAIAAAQKLVELRKTGFGIGYLPRTTGAAEGSMQSSWADSYAVGGDLDDAFNPDGSTVEKFADVVAGLKCYAEVSISGTGLRLFMPRQEGDDMSHETDGIGWMGTESKFVTFTGNVHEGHANLDGDPETRKWIVERCRGSGQKVVHLSDLRNSESSVHITSNLGESDQTAMVEALLASLDPDMSCDNWYRVIGGIHTYAPDWGLDLVDAWSSESVKGKYDQAEVAKLWSDFDGREESGRVQTKATIGGVMNMAAQECYRREEFPVFDEHRWKSQAKHQSWPGVRVRNLFSPVPEPLFRMEWLEPWPVLYKAAQTLAHSYGSDYGSAATALLATLSVPRDLSQLLIPVKRSGHKIPSQCWFVIHAGVGQAKSDLLREPMQVIKDRDVALSERIERQHKRGLEDDKDAVKPFLCTTITTANTYEGLLELLFHTKVGGGRPSRRIAGLGQRHESTQGGWVR